MSRKILRYSLTAVSMPTAKVIVLSVVVQGQSMAEAARRYDVPWQWVQTLFSRYQTGGLDALEPRSRRPSPTPAPLRQSA